VPGVRLDPRCTLYSAVCTGDCADRLTHGFFELPLRRLGAVRRRLPSDCALAKSVGPPKLERIPPSRRTFGTSLAVAPTSMARPGTGAQPRTRHQVRCPGSLVTHWRTEGRWPNAWVKCGGCGAARWYTGPGGGDDGCRDSTPPSVPTRLTRERTTNGGAGDQRGHEHPMPAPKRPQPTRHTPASLGGHRILLHHVSVTGRAQ
jgi:hypothetical protein